MKQYKLFSELSAAARAYLFPGVSFDKSFLDFIELISGSDESEFAPVNRCPADKIHKAALPERSEAETDYSDWDDAAPSEAPAVEGFKETPSPSPIIKKKCEEPILPCPRMDIAAEIPDSCAKYGAPPTPQFKRIEERKAEDNFFGRLVDKITARNAEKSDVNQKMVEVPDEDKLDPRTELILAEIRRLQEKYNVSIDELEAVIGYTVKLSPMRIMRSGKIFLQSFDNIEVKMPNVAKALYFLYLRHPEGLRFKKIADHRDELAAIYGNLTGRDDMQESEKSIDLLVDPFSNALNVNVSRIKAAFRNAVNDRIARFYYINGAAGDIKKVPLDRDLVIWEY